MSAKSLYQGRLINLQLETVDLPNGNRLSLELVKHPGGVVILTMDDKQNVCLLKQYRYAAGGWIWELPAGTLEAGEDTLTAAKRELQEETGCRANQWHTLGQIIPTPGFCDEILHLYLATELTQTSTHFDDEECIEIHWIDITTIESMIISDDIFDAKTISALYRYQLLKKAAINSQ